MVIPRTFALFFTIAILWLVGAQSVLAQEKTAPAKDMVLFDFENDSFDGWTLSGDCWGKEPASDALFPGKIKGFGGKRFVCTLDPKLGAIATGKAVSKEFTVSSQLITFKIGGGNYPQEACLNFVVEGKIVKTATGDNTSELVEKEWDVSPFIGKRAHLEIVDLTKSPQRGYIMVDDITFVALRAPTPPVQTVPLAVLLCRFADSEKVPASRSDYVKAFGSQFPGLAHYLGYCTGGRFSIQGTQVVGWLMLPFPKEHYAQIQDTTLRRIAIIRDAAQVAASQLDFRSFKHIVAFTSETLFQNSGEAGNMELQVGNSKRSFRWAFINDSNLAFQHRTIIHEVGHSIGLFHTWGQKGAEDPSWWSGMNGQSEYYAAGPNPHPYFGFLPLTYNGYDRLLLKGVAPEQVVEVKGGEEKTVDLINLNNPERGGTLLVRVPKPDGKTFYTVEARMYDGLYDRSGVLRSEGVVIHEIEPGRNQRSPTPGSKAADGADALVAAPPNATKGNAGKVAWQPEQVFIDAANGIQIRILSKVSRGYRILVSSK